MPPVELKKYISEFKPAIDNILKESKDAISSNAATWTGSGQATSFGASFFQPWFKVLRENLEEFVYSGPQPAPLMVEIPEAPELPVSGLLKVRLNVNLDQTNLRRVLYVVLLLSSGLGLLLSLVAYSIINDEDVNVMAAAQRTLNKVGIGNSAGKTVPRRVTLEVSEDGNYFEDVDLENTFATMAFVQSADFNGSIDDDCGNDVSQWLA